MAGRWLKQYHPEVREPADWNEALAAEYVTYTCQAKLGDLLVPANTRSLHFQKTSQQLSPRTIDGRLIFMRSFFSHLQRRTYTGQWQAAPQASSDVAAPRGIQNARHGFSRLPAQPKGYCRGRLVQAHLGRLHAHQGQVTCPFSQSPISSGLLSSCRSHLGDRRSSFR